MTRRPRLSDEDATYRSQHALVPQAKMWSESPAGRPGVVRPPRQAATSVSPWTYEDWMYFTIINQPNFASGADTRFAEANGQDFSGSDGTNDEEALVLSEADHDMWGGSPWSIYPGYGAVINNIGGSYLRLDSNEQGWNGTNYEWLVPTQLSWPVDQTLQEQYTDYYGYEGAEADYGSPYPFPADFNDAWITGYRVRFYFQGGETGSIYLQYVTDLPNDDPDYLETDVTVHPKVYVPYTGQDWNNHVWQYNEFVLPASTPGLPKASWTGRHRMRVGVDGGSTTVTNWDSLIDIDQCRVYVDYTIALP